MKIGRTALGLTTAFMLSACGDKPTPRQAAGAEFLKKNPETEYRCSDELVRAGKEGMTLPVRNRVLKALQGKTEIRYDIEPRPIHWDNGKTEIFPSLHCRDEDGNGVLDKDEEAWAIDPSGNNVKVDGDKITLQITTPRDLTAEERAYLEKAYGHDIAIVRQDGERLKKEGEE